MQVDLKVLRYDPERDDKPHWERYTVEAGPMDRLVDLLQTVKLQHDGTLTFRRSCVHGVCGSDAMLINGRNRLACKIRVDQLGKRISVAPLPGLPVVKDLVVEMDEFFGKYKSVLPFQVDDGSPMPERERRQSPKDRAVYDDTTKCILCAACTSSCPSFWAKPEYVGPAAIVNAHRFIFDTRDHGAHERLEILADENGVWRCRTIFNCTDACPRGINITRAILEVSGAVLDARRSRGGNGSRAPLEVISPVAVAPGSGGAPKTPVDKPGAAESAEGVGGHAPVAVGKGSGDDVGGGATV
jgi:succinate dehydrogenase / fumarate reductase iron-sulfur subunit